MISCLVDYIGLEGVTNSPKSGRYVNELQGLETSQFELIMKEEAYDADSAWAKVENRTIKKLETQIQAWAARYYGNYSLQSTTVTSQYNEKTTISQTANYAGWFFNGGSYFRNMSIIIPWIELYSDNAVSTSIKIFNASTGDLIDTITATLTANTINRVTINKDYPLWKYPNIFIAYDESEVQAIKVDDLRINGALSISQKRIPKTSAILEDNLSSIGTTGQGMSVNYNISCTLDNYVCQRLSIFEEPYMYLLGVEFCNERIFSDRVTRYTLLDRDQARELRDELQAEYDKALKASLDNLRFDNWDDYCFPCEGVINTKILLP